MGRGWWVSGRRWCFGSIVEYRHGSVGEEKLVLNNAFVSQKANGGEKDGNVRQVSVNVASPLQEGLAEGRPVEGVGEQGEELTRVPYGLLLVGWKLLEKGCPVE
jgi:hypothetical protein